MLDALKNAVRNRLRDLGRNAFEAAAAAKPKKLQRNYIDDLLRDKKQGILLDFLPRLASSLDWTAADLLEAIASDERATLGGSEVMAKKREPITDPTIESGGDAGRPSEESNRSVVSADQLVQIFEEMIRMKIETGLSRSAARIAATRILKDILNLEGSEEDLAYLERSSDEVAPIPLRQSKPKL